MEEKIQRNKDRQYPLKIAETMKCLISGGYFLRTKDIINIALFEYFAQKGFFELARQVRIEGETQEDKL